MDRPRTLLTLSALVGLACLVQAWTIGHAVLPAQDSIRYLTVAQSIARDGLHATLERQQEQPLFPLFACGVHEALDRLAPATSQQSADRWALSLQLAAALALVLAVIPIYLLHRQLVGHSAALVAGAFFCVIPEFSRLGADGLSDSTHLALACLALCAAVHAVRVPQDRPHAGRFGWWLATGFWTGCGLLTRAEVLAVPAAAAAILLLEQSRASTRRRWSTVALALGCLNIGVSLPLAPYLAACGVNSPREGLARVLGRRGMVESTPLNATAGAPASPALEEHWYLDGSGLLVFGRKDHSVSGRLHGALAAATELLRELGQACQYWVGALALIGCWRMSRGDWSASHRLTLLLALLVMAGGFYLAFSAGYLSSRHLLLVVVCGLGCAGRAALECGVWLREQATRPIGTGRKLTSSFVVPSPRPLPQGAREHREVVFRPTSANREPWRTGAAWSLLGSSVAVAACLACLPRTLAPLNSGRVGHRQAASWLAERAKADDAVLDSRGWTALYSGRKTYRYDAAQTAFTDPGLAYVVLEQAELDLDSRRGQTMRLLMSEAAERVACFRAPGQEPWRQVVVHRWYPERFAELRERMHAH